MKTKILLSAINAFYEEYRNNHDLTVLLHGVLKLYVKATESEIGFISSKISLSKGVPVTAPVFIFDALTNIISNDTDITCVSNKSGIQRYMRDYQSVPFTFVNGQNEIFYACIGTKGFRHSISYALPISPTETIVLGVASREGKYPARIKEKVRVTLETLTHLLKAYEGEINLQTNIDLLKQFARHVPAAVAMFDNEMHYIMTSRQWIKQELNVKKRSIKNKSHYDVVTDIPEHWKESHRRCLEGEVQKCEEEKIIRQDGTVQWLKWELRPWYKKNQVGGVLMFLEHITEQKKSEEKLQHLVKNLKESNIQLERFAHVCSHDLKEPLRTIASFIQLIQRGSKDFLNAQLEQYFDFVMDGVKRMRDLIDNLLLYSEMGGKKVNKEPFYLKEALNVAIRNNAHAIQEKNANVKLDNDGEIFADKFLTVQLLHNLLSNALKYVTKPNPIVRIGVQQTKEAWKVYVKDNGIGIEKEYQDAVFSRFKRLHSRNEYNGTGIGLAICKMIAEKHNGKIWVRSIVDQGSTFFFTIPYR